MSDTVQHRFDTPSPVELFVQNGRGRVEVSAADTAETTVLITGERAAEFTVEQDGDHVSVTAPRRDGGFFGREPRAEVVITVPDGSELTAKLGSSDLAGRGRLGGTWVNTGSGDVSFDTVDGTAEVQSGSGDVRVEELTTDARVKTGSGDVVVGRAHGPLVVTSGSGDVRIGHAAGPLAVKTGSGDVVVGESADDLTFSTGSGDLHVDRARRGRVTVKGASGDVVLGIPDGTPVWTDVSTVTGRITSDLRSAGEPAEGQDHVELRARTASGDITLQQR